MEKERGSVLIESLIVLMVFAVLSITSFRIGYYYITHVGTEFLLHEALVCTEETQDSYKCASKYTKIIERLFINGESIKLQIQLITRNVKANLKIKNANGELLMDKKMEIDFGNIK